MCALVGEPGHQHVQLALADLVPEEQGLHGLVGEVRPVLLRGADAEVADLARLVQVCNRLGGVDAGGAVDADDGLDVRVGVDDALGHRQGSRLDGQAVTNGVELQAGVLGGDVGLHGPDPGQLDGGVSSGRHDGDLRLRPGEPDHSVDQGLADRAVRGVLNEKVTSGRHVGVVGDYLDAGLHGLLEHWRRHGRVV